MIHKPYRLVSKVWGSERWLANGPAYCGKVLMIDPGAKTSIHYHQRKVETLFLATGRVAIYLGGDAFPRAGDGLDPIFCLEPGDCVTIQPYQRHGFHNVGETPAVLFEVSTQHFEDDSVRESESAGAPPR